MTTVDLLQQIGLNRYEAEAYYTLLAQGALTGYEVGKYSHVPGSRSYEVLERLLAKGLVLLQPGDPPRYSAQDPRFVVERFRSTMETTLDTLATSLASLAHADAMSGFWVVRGQQNMLARVRSLIEDAQATLEIVLPADWDVTETLVRAQARGCRTWRATADGQDDRVVLLMRDDREALLGTATPPDSSQAVVSSNQAFLVVLRGYFLLRQAPARHVYEVTAAPARPHDVDWMDWEARKQRRLRGVSAGGRVA
jgi:HTH-type transcriptional regulator, sugar sensing transcriptional regulator